MRSNRPGLMNQVKTSARALLKKVPILIQSHDAIVRSSSAPAITLNRLSDCVVCSAVSPNPEPVEGSTTVKRKRDHPVEPCACTRRILQPPRKGRLRQRRVTTG